MVLWQSNYVSEFDTVFDAMFNYLEEGITTLDLCDLEAQYQSMFFEAYMTAFAAVLQANDKSVAPLSDPTFNDCSKEYFMMRHGDVISEKYHLVEQRYNMFLRYLQALATSDAVLATILDHVLSPECQDSLLRMTHCAQCAGVNNSSVLPCKYLCLNVQRGCLVDLYELGVVYKSLYSVMKEAQYVVDQYDPFGVMQSLASTVVNMLDDFEEGYAFVADGVSSPLSPKITM